MDLARILVVRFFTETLGMKYVGESGDAIWLEEGLNKVVVGLYLSEIYEEAELYKRAGTLLALGANKTFLAVLPEALPYVDPRFFKNNGVGLVAVDPTRGADGVEVKIYPRARATPTAQIDPAKLEELKRALMQYVDAELKRAEASLFEKIKRYVDQRLEEVKYVTRPAEKPAEETPKPPTSPISENEWVRLLRSKGR